MAMFTARADISTKEVFQQESMDVPEELDLQIKHRHNGLTYHVLPVVSTYLSSAFLSRFVQMVNEADILRLLEEEGISVNGRYTEKDARSFLSAGIKDWENGHSRLFLVLQGNAPAGCFAFKSCSNDAEIGYWIGGKHRGLGTDLLAEMLRLAPEIGYTQLKAITREDNIASRKILGRNGFMEVDRYEKNMIRFRLHRWLAPGQPVSQGPEVKRFQKIRNLSRHLQRIR